MTKLAIEEALKQKTKQEQEKAQIPADNLNDKRHPTEENVFKQPPLEEGKEIDQIKADVILSERKEKVNVEDGADENGSPEQTNLLRASTIVPIQTNEFSYFSAKNLIIRSQK